MTSRGFSIPRHWGGHPSTSYSIAFLPGIGGLTINNVIFSFIITSDGDIHSFVIGCTVVVIVVVLARRYPVFFTFCVIRDHTAGIRLCPQFYVIPLIRVPIWSPHNVILIIVRSFIRSIATVADGTDPSSPLLFVLNIITITHYLSLLFLVFTPVQHTLRFFRIRIP